MEEVTSVATSLLHHDSITSCFTSLLRIFWSYMYKDVNLALLVMGCKFRPMLVTYGLWAGRISSCNICFDTGPRFLRSPTNGRPIQQQVNILTLSPMGNLYCVWMINSHKHLQCHTFDKEVQCNNYFCCCFLFKEVSLCFPS